MLCGNTKTGNFRGVATNGCIVLLRSHVVHALLKITIYCYCYMAIIFHTDISFAENELVYKLVQLTNIFLFFFVELIEKTQLKHMFLVN